MKIIKTLFFQSLVLTAVLASFNVYAVDQSICHSVANVLLYDNGSLKSCQLKDDYVANDIRCKNDSPVSFYSDGNLEFCVLFTDTTVAENKCKQDSPISFFIDGNLKSCVKPDN